ncbi:MAG: carboxymuconolactone decarboxylase family protein [Bacteroidota bacterium]
MKSIVTLILFSFSLVPIVQADGPPPYIKDTFPEHAMMEILKSWGAVKGEGAAIDGKTRELIALAVAAQIPCEYCVYAHTTRLKEKMSASDAELKEAVAIAGYIRLFSTVFNGNGYSFEDFQAEFDKALN